MNGVQLVKIRKGMNFSREISGVFPLVREFEPNSNSKKQGFVHVVINGKTKRLQVDASDVMPVVKKLTKEELVKMEKTIDDRFFTLEILVKAAVDSKLRALAVSGAAGIGKSYTVQRELEPLINTNPTKYGMMRGFSSGLGLYEQLYIHRHQGCVLVFDDIDSIFGDDASLNLLKGALDTTGDRIIGWYTDSNYLRQLDIPNSFTFHGTVIMLTNLDFDAIIQSGNRMSSTVQALISRTTYLNLKVHSNEEIMIRIRQLVRAGKLVKKQELIKTIMDWMEKNQSNLRYLSLRSILQLEKLMEIAPNDWERIAENTMFVS